MMAAVMTLCLLCAVVAAADEVNVDARFDKTGDAIVDGQDWDEMTDEEKKAYARQSVIGLGQDPDVVVEYGKTRAFLYLEGLRSVYE
ncbi:MAG: hypothetical protein R8K46_03370 [Mariprofundaceae bacterium]